MKARTGRSRARALSPDVLAMDESISRMDRESREQTYFLIRRLVSERVADLYRTYGSGGWSVVHESVAVGAPSRGQGGWS